ncbi:MAG: hypothetical protein ACHQII_03035, partial [Bacteroidia bacterium]
MKYLATITFLLVISCCTNNVNRHENTSIKFFGNYNICDTCQTTILVHHDECTTCGDILVDSGTVYFTNQIYKQANALVDSSAKADSFLLSPNNIDVNQLYFSNPRQFTKLWSDAT